MEEQTKPSDPSSEQQHRRGTFAQEKGEVILREHEFDGIQEFDQKLPNWWLFTLYIAIAWSLVHWFLHYHTGVTETDAERMELWKAELQERQDAEKMKLLAEIDDAALINVWSTDPDILAKGETTYSTFCVACHAPDLSGKIAGAPLPGLPLTDGEWKYGGKPLDLYKLISEGTPPDSEGHNGAKMTPWGPALGPEKVAQVTAFVISKNREEYPVQE